jgi:hypothetical protein
MTTDIPAWTGECQSTETDEEPESQPIWHIPWKQDRHLPTQLRPDVVIMVLSRRRRSSADGPGGRGPGLIAEGQAIARACVQRGRPGPYQIQAAINGVHSVAPNFDSTEWHAILTLYDQLHALTPTPVIALNRGSRARRSPRPRRRPGRGRRPAFFGPGQLLPVPRHTRRPATPPRPHHRSRGRLRHRPRPHHEPGRTSLPRHPARRQHPDREGVTESP